MCLIDSKLSGCRGAGARTSRNCLAEALDLFEKLALVGSTERGRRNQIRQQVERPGGGKVRSPFIIVAAERVAEPNIELATNWQDIGIEALPVLPAIVIESG